jgi:hypothetical protein
MPQRQQNNRRRRRTAMRKGTQIMRSSAKRTIGHPEPPPINNVITVNYRAQQLVTAVTGTPFIVNPATIGGLLPGTTNAWAQFRLIKVEAWGSDSTSNTSLELTIAEISSSGLQFQGTVYNDFGTQGAQRAHISVLPGSLFELTWFSTTDTSVNLFTIGTDSVPTFDIIYQVTLEIRSVQSIFQ